MRSQKEVRCGTPLFGPHDGSLSSSIYPCGKARNSPQEGALKEGESSSESITLCGVEGEDIGTGQDYSAPRSPMLFTFVGGWV